MPNSTVKTVAAIFKKSTFKKWLLQEKFKYQVEVASTNKHAVFTSYGIEISTFLKKKKGDKAEVVQCPLQEMYFLYLSL